MAITFKLTGNNGNNVLFGTKYSDTLMGLGGSDWLFGEGKDDVLDGGTGNDMLRGGAGRDILNGGEGDDYLLGGGGRDTAVYEGGIDDYQVIRTGAAKYTVASIGPVADAGTDDLVSIEMIYFAADDITMYIDGRNNRVVARDDAFAIGEDDTLIFTADDLIANDRELDGDRMRVVDFDATSASGATITRVGDDFTYDPGTLFDGLAEGETATDTFTYRVGDGRGGSTVATVEVTINGADDVVLPDARINEFHYDNSGGDVGEFVEVRVAAGTDATDLLLEFYNGDGGAVYGSAALDGLTPVTQGPWDYYTISLPANGLQNGGADGIALSYQGSVIEFLSYEGKLTAVGGAADGMMSDDIGVAESSSTPSGFSLQRNDDGTWRAPGAETPGAENIPPLAALVITEIMQNPSAVNDSEGEWFEIYNAGTYPVDINGWTISDDGSDSHVIDNGGPLVIDAGGYLVLARNGDTNVNGGVSADYVYGTDINLSNGADEIVLTDMMSREVDRVAYDGGPIWPDPAGASMALQDLGADNNDGANWAAATEAYGDGDLGTPGETNTPPSEILVINEIMQNPSAVSDSNGEWFELYNPGDADIDIDGWTISDAGSDSHVINNGGPLVIPAGGYLVLGNNGDINTNGGVPVDYEYSGFTLANGDDEVILSNASGEEVDRAEYDGGAAWPDPAGASMSLSDPTADNNDGANWASATSTYGDGDLGTPGAANDDTGGPVGEPTVLLIGEIQGTGSATPVNNQLVQTTAIVTYAVSDGFFMQDSGDGNAATSDGIFVFTGGAGLPSLGDEVRVTGTATESFGLTQIGSNLTVEILSSGNALPLPELIALGPDELQMFEPLESMRIELASATADPLTVIENFELARYGEIVVGAGSQYQPTQLYDAQTELAEIEAMMASNAQNRLKIDDGVPGSNPTEFAYIPGGTGDDGDGILDADDNFTETGPTLRLGTELTANPTGVLSYSFGEYKMLVDGTLQIDQSTNEGARQTSPDAVGGDLQIGAFNVLNYFTTLDNGSGTSGPNGLDPRGATTAADLERQTDKLVSAMSASGVEVFAVQEVENNGFDGSSAIGTLTAALNTETGKSFAVVDPNGGTSPFIGTDAITTGIIYDTAAVTLVDSAAVVFAEPSAAATFAAAEALATELGISNSIADLPRNRPAVVATFEDAVSGETFTVVSVHFKSKGDSGLEDMRDAALAANAAGGLTASQQAAVDAMLADPNVDSGNGQGYWNGARADAAQEIYDFLTNDYGGSGVENWIVMGDYNAYSQEDPTQALSDPADTVNLIDQYIGEDAYSFVFDGQRGALDQAVASDGLADHVTGLTEWHINADEPGLLDYSSRFNDDRFYSDDMFAASDHDPVILGLSFDPFLTV